MKQKPVDFPENNEIYFFWIGLVHFSTPCVAIG